MKHAKQLIFVAALAAASLTLAACQKQGTGAAAAVAPASPTTQATEAPDASAVTLVHVHGLSYNPDGKALFIPSHVGLAVFSDGKWSKAPGPQHDYMGFAATHDAFYSSGHPAPGSNAVNPFGLVRSVNGGQTWQKLGFEGQADFHTLATGYNTDAVYVFNHQPNDKMSGPGIYATTNDGRTWRKAEGDGLSTDQMALAVHPDQPSVVAAATENGLFLSTDGGDHFRPVATGAQVVSAFFDLDGKDLWYGSFSGQAKLTRIDLKAGQGVDVPLPALGQDAVAYMAQNPSNRKEYAIATFNRNVYLSEDRGQTWKQIAKNGETL